jgi:Flp pilus assembly protein TadG
MSEKRSASRKRRGKGQGLLEFALILPLLLLIIMAIIDFGWILLVYANVFNASREGVRYGVTRPRDYDGINANARSRIAMVPADDVSISTWYDRGPEVASDWFTDTNEVNIGDRVVVDVQYAVIPITPLMQPILGELNLHANAARTIQSLGDAVSLPPPGSGGPPGGATATATLTGSETPTATSSGMETPTPTPGTPTPSATYFPSATPTPTPLPIDISDPLTEGDMTVEGSAQANRWVTMRDIQSGVQMDVEVDDTGHFLFSLFQPLVGGHTVVVQGYGQQDTAVVQGGLPTATPTTIPTPTPTPATEYIFADPSCGGIGERTIDVVGRNWPPADPPNFEQIGVYWDYGGPNEQKVVIPAGPSTFTATFTVNIDRGTYTIFAQAEKPNGEPTDNQNNYEYTVEYQSPCDASFPNLQVTGLALQDPVPTGTYEEVWLDVTVSNVGDADVASLFWVDLYADPDMETPLVEQASVDWVAINGLSVGSSITFTMYYLGGFTSIGDHIVVGVVDTWDQIAESEEADNVSAPLTVTLSVDNPEPTPVPTSAATPESPGSINGNVRISMDSGTIGQEGADVYVYDSYGRLVASARSGVNGYYTVGNLEPGDYVVVGQIRLSGILYRGQNVVTVPPDTTVNAVDVYLIEVAGSL